MSGAQLRCGGADHPVVRAFHSDNQRLPLVAGTVLVAAIWATYVPVLWPAVLLSLVAVTFWLGMDYLPHMVFVVMTPATVSVAAIAALNQPDGWEIGLGLAVALMLVANRVNRRIHNIIDQTDQANAVIRRQARTDELTGLPNRSHYLNELDHRLVDQRQFAVIMMDLDRFKTINDTLGHAFGDAVLVEIATRLDHLVKVPDVVARLGGDEFAIIAESATTPTDALRYADAIATAVIQTMQLSGMSISTTPSIGVALAPSDGRDAQSLMRRADIAMYEAKRRNNTTVLFNTEIQQTPVEELTLSASLKEALVGDQFTLYFQPKIDMTTGRIVGFEGLARWQHPTLGLLTPDRFIHLVTLSDESQAFAYRIIEVGIEFAVECATRGLDVPIAVNLSARSLFDDTLPDRTAYLLRTYGLPADRLTIEITEADIMDEAGHSSRVLARLAGLGVTVSIDDFGTGYSSLARLVDLPISEVKIDRHFVSRLSKDPRDEVVVYSIIDLAKTLGLHVVAEGVENLTEAEMLVAAGCREAQGFLFSPPRSPCAALMMLDDSFVVPTMYFSTEQV